MNRRIGIVLGIILGVSAGICGRLSSDPSPTPTPTRTPTPAISPLPTVTPTPALIGQMDSSIINRFAFVAEWDANDAIFNEGLLRVIGLADPPLKPLTALNCQVMDWRRPKTPNDVKITLETSDGRLWRAKWEEVKP